MPRLCQSIEEPAAAAAVPRLSVAFALSLSSHFGEAAQGIRFSGKLANYFASSRRKLSYSSQDFTTAAESGAEWE